MSRKYRIWYDGSMFPKLNPTGSSMHVNFTTSKTSRWQTDPRRCQINWVILDSDWEAEFCRVAETHPLRACHVVPVHCLSDVGSVGHEKLLFGRVRAE